MLISLILTDYTCNFVDSSGTRWIGYLLLGSHPAAYMCVCVCGYKLLLTDREVEDMLLYNILQESYTVQYIITTLF